jgi:ABC-type Fe3+ transport system permease subunit
MNSSIGQIHQELEEAAYVCGATSTRTLLAITMPLLFPAFAAGWIWVSVHALRAFSIPLMLSSKKNEVFAGADVAILVGWRYFSSVRSGRLADDCARPFDTADAPLHRSGERSTKLGRE